MEFVCLFACLFACLWDTDETPAGRTELCFFRMEKAESTESKFSFKLFLRIRPQKNGNTDLMDYLNVKDSKHLRLEVPEDSVVGF